MKTVMAIVIAAFVIAAPAFAVFDVGTTIAVDNSSKSWNTGGDVKEIGGFAEFGKFGINNGDTLWTSLISPTDGQYTSTFDYQFTGVDDFAIADADQKYWPGFELNELSLNHQDQLITFFDINNASLTSGVQAVPAPGVILLSAIGAAFVGWLRSRRAI